jgi:hypothetical protein
MAPDPPRYLIETAKRSNLSPVALVTALTAAVMASAAER